MAIFEKKPHQTGFYEYRDSFYNTGILERVGTALAISGELVVAGGPSSLTSEKIGVVRFVQVRWKWMYGCSCVFLVVVAVCISFFLPCVTR